MRLPDSFLVDGVSWPLRRAWPRTEDVCPLELQQPGRDPVVGQWFASPEDARRERGRTPGARDGDDLRLVLQPDGADRRLPGLAPMLQDGAQLLAHRPGRRAVVRMLSGRYVKVTRSGRAGALDAKHRLLAGLVAGLADVPEVLDVTEDRVVLAAVPGMTPLELPDGGRAVWRRTWQQVGAVLTQLAAAQPEGLPVHDAHAEAEVARSWVARAVATGRLPARDIDGLLVALTDGARTATGVVHRDLHDGQLLVSDGRLGLLDPDTLAVAEPVLDLANLLVHLELRVAQGLLAPDRARQAAAILRRAADDAVPGTLARLPAYVRATRLRLAAVYSLRPRWHDLAFRWYDEVTATASRSDRVGRFRTPGLAADDSSFDSPLA